MTEYEYEYYSAFQNWPNTNTNIIRASKNDRIRIRILFGSPKTQRWKHWDREELNWSPSSVKKLSRMKFKGWFVEEKSEHEKITRTQKPSGLMKQIPCRTQRYQRSSLPLMTKILAWHPPLPPPVLKLPWFYPSLSKSWLLWYKSRQHTATSWAFELYHLRLYSLKYTVNISCIWRMHLHLDLFL